MWELVLTEGQSTNFLVTDNMSRPYKIKMLTLSTFSLTKWCNKYILNSLELTISARLNNHEEGRAKEVGDHEEGEQIGGG